MAYTVRVDVADAERELYSGAGRFVVAPAEQGDIGVYPRHAPLLARLRPGLVRIVPPEGEDRLIAISGGFIEVQRHAVTVLADVGVRAAETDEAHAARARAAAERRLSRARAGSTDYEAAKRDLQMFTVLLRAIEDLARHRRGQAS